VLERLSWLSRLIIVCKKQNLHFIFCWYQRHKAKPIQHQDKAIPLCLPNNVSWNPATGKVTKTSEDRRSLHPVPAAVEMLQQIKGVDRTDFSKH